MRKDLAAIVCCPADRAKLTLAATKVDEHEDVVEGTLTCTECGFVYPVEGGIPNLLPPEFHVDADGNPVLAPAARVDSGGVGDEADAGDVPDDSEE